MSVLIKNMEMPSRCYDCTFSKWSNLHQTKACNCGSNYFKPCFEDNSEEFYTKRADFCPIVEVPVPHGDLIDRNALKPDICHDWNGYDVPDDDYSAKCIKNAPTVIEAEGTE